MQYRLVHFKSIVFSILLTHERSHREVYQEFKLSYDILRRSGAKG